MDLKLLYEKYMTKTCNMCEMEYKDVSGYSSFWLKKYCSDCNKMCEFEEEQGVVKECGKCHEYIDRENDFHRRGLAGRQSYCKWCMNDYNRENRIMKKMLMV